MPVTSAINLGPGQTVLIPANYKIKNLIVEGSAEISTECTDKLPLPETLKCYELSYAFEIDNGGGTGPWNISDLKLVAVGIMGTEYLYPATESGQADGFSGIANEIPTLSTFISEKSNGVINVTNQVLVKQTNERYATILSYNSTDAVNDQFYLKFTLFNNQVARVYGRKIDCPSINS
jgi:hypothetical protein